LANGLQDAAPGRETDFLARLGDPVMPEDMGRGQGGVAAQVDFDPGREPAQVEMVSRLHEKCRFGQVHLGGNRLQPVIYVL
jgi:hypothetical protein